MKRAIIIGIALLAFLQPDVHCQKSRNQIKVKPDSVAVDSIEYELIVFDVGFNSWLISKPPMSFYSQQYFESRNRLYVMEWNNRYRHPHRYGDLYDSEIEYFPWIDYGLELNYKLYFYFLFFEETNHVKLIDRGR